MCCCALDAEQEEYGPKMAQNGPKTAPKMAQDGAKTAPRLAKMARRNCHESGSGELIETLNYCVAGPQKMRERGWPGGKMEAENTDFAWEILEKFGIKGVRGRALRPQSGGFV